jgi:hypothetical protein
VKNEDEIKCKLLQARLSLNLLLVGPERCVAKFCSLRLEVKYITEEVINRQDCSGVREV